MAVVDTKFYEKKNSRVLLISLIFFFFVVLLTFGLFFYKNYVDNHNDSMVIEIGNRESSIADIETDPSVKAYLTYMKYEGFLEALQKKSQITSFIAHFKSTPRRYGIETKGFTYADGKVSLDVAAQTNDASYAYEKIVKFLREYNVQKDVPFEMQNIQTFTGYDKVTYSAEFLLK